MIRYILFAESSIFDAVDRMPITTAFSSFSSTVSDSEALVTMTSTNKIPLPSFLKLLTSNNVSTPKAMAVAGKMSLSFPIFHTILMFFDQ
jgi:hypothetical protein